MSGMFYRWTTLLVLCVSAAVASAAPKPKIESDRSLGFFTATRAETLALVKRVGILPVVPPPGYEDREDMKALLAKSVMDHLRLAGLDVVGPEAYQASYDRLNRQIGGMYDPDTGERKQDKYSAVVQNALREFVEEQQLNGLVVVRIRPATATFFSDVARWDGVSDMSIGRRRANALTAFLAASDATGRLPAYSVLLQISNPELKVLYGRAGGLQLASYYDPAKAKGDYNFLTVPSENMFRDPARIERAVRIATLPLRYTAEEIAAGEKDKAFNPELIQGDDLPPGPEGVERVAASPFKVERTQILEKVKRVAISSIAVGRFSPSEEVRARYIELVRAELAPLGWELSLAPKAHEDLGYAVKQAGGLYDPLTGKLQEGRASMIRKTVMSSLAGPQSPDAVLWLSLSQSVASHNMGDATWDGVSQSAITLGPVKKNFWTGSAAVMAGEGGLQAISLSVQLRDVNDVVLYQSRGGIQLAQQIRGKEKFALAPNELFTDPSREQPAVHAALRDLVLTPEQLEEELHPKPKKK